MKLNKDKLMYYMNFSNTLHLINKSDAENLFEELSTKLINDDELTNEEQKFLEDFMKNYYPEYIGGELYPYPKYDEKLKPIYKNVASFFIKNLNKNTEGSVTFLQYFYLTQMAKEYNIKPYIYTKEKEYFKKNPNTRAYHSKEPTNHAPIISYNPLFIKNARNESILQLIITGFHELEHEVQESEIQKTKIDDAQALLWAKEFLIRFVVGDIYYKTNYFDIFHERDARDYARKRLKQICIEEKCNYKIPILKEDSYDLNIKHKDVENEKEIIAIDLLDAITNEYIKAYPWLLKEYPVLKTIYNDNGTKKVLPQIRSELEIRMQEEIKKNPEKIQEIKIKYKRLIKNIAKTDNDLQLQYLCEEIAQEISDKKLINLTSIKELLRKRDFCYEDFMERINSRISYLRLLLYKKEVSNSPEYQNLYNELRDTENLKKVVIEYNPKFKEKYNEEQRKLKIKNELDRILEKRVEKYKYTFGKDGTLYAEKQTKEELFDSFKKYLNLLTERTKNPEELDKYIKYLQDVYKDYYDDVEKKKSVPNRM